MKIPTNFKPALAASVFLLAASQMNLVQADDNTGYYQVHSLKLDRVTGPTDNLTPG